MAQHFGRVELQNTAFVRRRTITALIPHFDEMPGVSRSITCRPPAAWLSRGSSKMPSARTSCLIGRQALENLRRCWLKERMNSVDGLPTDFAPETMPPREAAE